MVIEASFVCRVYQLLNVLEFNSSRKRMSVIVRDEDGKILLLCKGADRSVHRQHNIFISYFSRSLSFRCHFLGIGILSVSRTCLYSVMFERLSGDGKSFEEATMEHVNVYADAGLRTLILAYRELDEDEYMKFNKKFNDAKNTVSEDRESLIDETTETIEKDLILLGATAVEDKLQNGVSIVIQYGVIVMQ